MVQTYFEVNLLLDAQKWRFEDSPSVASLLQRQHHDLCRCFFFTTETSSWSLQLLLLYYRDSLMIFAVASLLQRQHHDLCRCFFTAEIASSLPLLLYYRGSIMIFVVFSLIPYFIWILSIRNTIRHTCWCCNHKHKLSKVKAITKIRKIVSYYILPFFVRAQTILIKMGSWAYILMTNEVFIVILTLYFQTVVDILSFVGESISLWNKPWSCTVVVLLFKK